MSGRSSELIVRYEDELKLFRTWQQKVGYLALAVLWLWGRSRLELSLRCPELYADAGELVCVSLLQLSP